MVPLFKFYFHDGVRTAAAEAMPHLLECAQIRGEQYVYEMWNYICNDLIKAIDSEPEQEVLAELMRSFARVKKLFSVFLIFVCSNLTCYISFLVRRLYGKQGTQ